MKKDNLSEILKEVNELIAAHPSMPHLSNIKAKFSGGKNSDETTKLWNFYKKYIHDQLAITGFSDKDIESRVDLLNNYYKFYSENNYDTIFTSQGKMRSTILEEFIFLLFHPFVNSLKEKYKKGKEVLDGRSVKAYTNLYVSAGNIRQFIESPKIKLNEKDQDYAIFRQMEVMTENNNKLRINTPVIAIECKTYIDKTMLQGIIATAEDLKSGNPFSWFGVVGETYNVDLAVDLRRTRIDQIYILRKQRHKEKPEKPIDCNVVIRLFNDVKNHVEGSWADTQNKLVNEGILI